MEKQKAEDSRHCMKILSIVWYKVLPPRFGGQKGIAYFNKELAKIHPLVCLCSANNQPADDHLYKIRNELPNQKKQFISPAVWRKIKQVAIEEQITHILLEHPYHGIAAIKAAKAVRAKLIVHSHNIESQRFRQLGKWWWWLMYYYERWVHRKAYLNLFKTKEDLQWAIANYQLAAEKCMLVPYGIEKSLKQEDATNIIRQRHKIANDEKILFFAATLDYLPNAKAVEQLYQQVAPALSGLQTKCRIIICGRNKFAPFQYLNQLNHPNIIMAGEVEDIDNYFYAADVFINPVATGAGVQTKNIDAISYGLPVVCFAQLLSADDKANCGHKLFIAKQNNWKQFIEQIRLAITNNKAPVSETFFAYYSFAIHAEKLAARLNSV